MDIVWENITKLKWHPQIHTQARYFGSVHVYTNLVFNNSSIVKAFILEIRVIENVVLCARVHVWVCYLHNVLSTFRCYVMSFKYYKYPCVLKSKSCEEEKTAIIFTLPLYNLLIIDSSMGNFTEKNTYSCIHVKYHILFDSATGRHTN